MRVLICATAAIALCGASVATAQAQSLGFSSLSAFVSAAGVTVRSAGVENSSRPATGKYVVEFVRPVNTCAYLAGPHGTTGGQASAAPVTGQPKKLEISTFNKTGAAASIAFVLLVSCADFPSKPPPALVPVRR